MNTGTRSEAWRGAWWRVVPVALAALAVAWGGCAAKEKPAGSVRLQTDWYAQGEHGGYYQALAAGYYREAGLDVEVLVGGPGAFVPQKVATGDVEFGMGRSDDVILAVAQGLPVVMVAALMQRDPQALLLHAENPVTSFRELDGRTIMAAPGSNWIRYLEVKNGISLRLVPLNYGMAAFMADKDFIQQCFVTNEPYYAEKNGAKVKTLLIADSGYDPYRVILTSRKVLAERPEVVRAFVTASTRGWESYLSGDPAAADAVILGRNVQMTPEFLEYTRSALRERKLVTGDPARGERTGLLTRERIRAQIDLLVELKLLEKALRVEDVADLRFAGGG